MELKNPALDHLLGLDAVRTRLAETNLALTAVCYAFETADRERNRPSLDALMTALRAFAREAGTPAQACAEVIRALKRKGSTSTTPKGVKR